MMTENQLAISEGAGTEIAKITLDKRLLTGYTVVSKPVILGLVTGPSALSGGPGRFRHPWTA